VKCKICGESIQMFPNKLNTDVCRKHLLEKWKSRKTGEGNFRVKVICNGYVVSFLVKSLESAEDCVKGTDFFIEKFDSVKHSWVRVK